MKWRGKQRTTSVFQVDVNDPITEDDAELIRTTVSAAWDEAQRQLTCAVERRILNVARGDKAKVRAIEREAVAMCLAGETFEDIAEKVGYASRSGAYEAVKRALKRERSEDVASLRDIEIARTDAILASIWPVAIGRPELVNWSDEEKQAVGNDEPETYVVLPGDKLKAIEKVIKILERRSRYLGLEFSDGIAERQIALAEREGEMIAEAMKAILDDPEIGLTKEQRARAGGVARRHLSVVSTAS